MQHYSLQNKPPKEELEGMLSIFTLSSIAEHYGVTFEIIEYWLFEYHLK